MISRRLAAALIAAPAAFTLAACASSTTDGSGGGGPTGTAGSSAATGSAPSSSAPPTGATSSASSASSSMPQDAKGLYALMISSLGKTTSMHVDFKVSTAGQTLAGSGDEKISGGKATAMKIKESVPGSSQSIVIILVDGKIYAQLPPQINTTGKPYLLITANSSDATVRQLATSLQSSLDNATTGSYAAFTQAADQFKLVGSTTVDGAPATRYAITMNPTKLPPDYKGKAALVASGLTAIPVDLIVGSTGRILEIDEHFTVQGKKVDTKVVASRYNQPVSITAPPASQVGTK